MKNKNKFFVGVLVLFLCGLFGISSTFASTGSLIGTGTNAKYYQQKDRLSLSLYKSTNIKVENLKKQLSTFISNVSKLIDKNSNDSKLSEEQKLSINTRLYSINAKLTNILNIIDGSGSTYGYTGSLSRTSTGETINSCATVPNLLNLGTITTGNPTSVEQERVYSSIPGNCTYSCSNGYSGNNCTIPPVSDITPTSTGTTLSSTECTPGMTEITLKNGQTWSCLNLGATTVWDGVSTFKCNSATDCSNKPSWVGDYYQWGRNDTGFTNGTGSAPYYDGWEAQNDTKWGGSNFDTSILDGSGTTSIGRQGPCPTGWHVPSAKDWKSACDGRDNCFGMGSSGLSKYTMAKTLRLPLAGFNGTSGTYKSYYDGYNNQGSSGYYWSSSPAPSPYNYYSSYFYIFDGHIDTTVNKRAMGFNIRCLKN